jgi:hypothetical protein
MILKRTKGGTGHASAQDVLRAAEDVPHQEGLSDSVIGDQSGVVMVENVIAVDPVPLPVR